MNKAILMGRLTAAPELKYTPSGVAVTSFTVAVDRRYTPKDGEKVTDFLSCVAWRQTAEFLCKYFTKGQMVALEGEIQTRKYTGRDGSNRTATEIVVDQVWFCGGKREAQPDPLDGLEAQAEAFGLSGGEPQAPDDDLPF